MNESEQKARTRKEVLLFLAAALPFSNVFGEDDIFDLVDRRTTVQAEPVDGPFSEWNREVDHLKAAKRLAKLQNPTLKRKERAE